MKKYLLIVSLLIASIYGQINRTLGDINDDGEINVVDIVLLVSYDTFLFINNNAINILIIIIINIIPLNQILI